MLTRLGALGDVVHVIPVVAALGHRFPDAIVDWVIDELYSGLPDLVPGLDRRLVLRTRGWPAVAGWAALRRELREVPYDVALDVQRHGKSALLAGRSCASPGRAGSTRRAPTRVARVTSSTENLGIPRGCTTRK